MRFGVANPSMAAVFFFPLFSFFFDLLSTAEGAHNEDRGTWVETSIPRHVIHVTYRRRLSIACFEIERMTFCVRVRSAWCINASKYRDFMLAINPLLPRSTESSTIFPI